MTTEATSDVAALLSLPCSPWLVVYAVTAVCWAAYAARMTRQEWGAKGKVWLSFALNFALCPVAILWAAIFQANADVLARGESATPPNSQPQ